MAGPLTHIEPLSYIYRYIDVPSDAVGDFHILLVELVKSLLRRAFAASILSRISDIFSVITERTSFLEKSLDIYKRDGPSVPSARIWHRLTRQLSDKTKNHFRARMRG